MLYFFIQENVLENTEWKIMAILYTFVHFVTECAGLSY